MAVTAGRWCVGGSCQSASIRINLPLVQTKLNQNFSDAALRQISSTLLSTRESGSNHFPGYARFQRAGSGSVIISAQPGTLKACVRCATASAERIGIHNPARWKRAYPGKSCPRMQAVEYAFQPAKAGDRGDNQILTRNFARLPCQPCARPASFYQGRIHFHRRPDRSARGQPTSAADRNHSRLQPESTCPLPTAAFTAGRSFFTRPESVLPLPW